MSSDAPASTLSSSTQALRDKGLSLKLVGLGGAGANIVDRLKMEDLGALHLATVNTDAQALADSPVGERLLLGESVTRGLSAGGEAELGRQAAEADREALAALVRGVDLVFILAGLGGGTGGGAAPVLAEVARAEGALVVAFVNLPFSFEGRRRLQQAEASLRELRQHCSAVVSLPNDLLWQELEPGATVMEAFALADSWTLRGVRAIAALLLETGLVNVDFAALQGALPTRSVEKTLFAFAEVEQPEGPEALLRRLEVCPLLRLAETRGARVAEAVVMQVYGGPDLSLTQVKAVVEGVRKLFGDGPDLVWGAHIAGHRKGTLGVTVFAVSGRKPQHVGPAQAAPGQGSTAAPMPQSAARTLVSGKRGSGKRRRGARKDVPQEEFNFEPQERARGSFSASDPNLFEGEDLDIPAFVRRGIRIQL